MKKELKSIFKNKIVIFVFIAGMFISMLNIIEIEDLANNSNQEAYYDLKKVYVDYSEEIDRQRLLVDKNDKIRLTHLEYLEWNKQRLYDKANYYLDSFSKHEDTIRDTDLVRNVVQAELNRNSDKEESVLELFKDDIDKNLGKDFVDFDLKEISGIYYKTGEYRKEYNQPIYLNYAFALKRDFYLKNKNIKEIDYSTKSPWTYIGKTYFRSKVKNDFFLSILILLLVYILTTARKEKTFDLVATRSTEKKAIYTYYFKVFMVVIFTLYFLPDLISILYMGLRYGFEGLNNVIPIDKEALTSFSTYKNVGLYEDETFGLAKALIVKMGDDLSYLNYDLDLVELWKVFLLAFAFDSLKLILFGSISLMIGLLIKDTNKSLMVAVFVGLFAVLSRFLGFLYGKINIFSYLSGFAVAMGGTQVSYMLGLLIIIFAIGLVNILSRNIFSRRDLV